MRVLLCPPKFFKIFYEINPWMDIKRNAIHEQAQLEWNAYRDLLKSLGAQIELIEPKDGLPDMVFTANAGFVFGNRVIMSNMRHKERQPEASYFERWFRDNGFEVLRAPEGFFYEGEGDTVVMGEKAFFGSPFRTDPRAHGLVAKILGKKPISLTLVDERFYHLDMAFFELKDDAVAYYPEAFDKKSIALIEENVKEKVLIAEDDVLNFAGNSIVLNGNVIANKGCAKFKASLEGRGFKVYELDFSEFMKSGGGAKCLALCL